MPVPAQQRRWRHQEIPPTARAAATSPARRAPCGPPGCIGRPSDLTAQHHQLVPQHRDLHRIRVRRRTAPEHAQKTPNDPQRHRTDDHTMQPARSSTRRSGPSPRDGTLQAPAAAATATPRCAACGGPSAGRRRRPRGTRSGGPPTPAGSAAAARRGTPAPGHPNRDLLAVAPGLEGPEDPNSSRPGNSTVFSSSDAGSHADESERIAASAPCLRPAIHHRAPGAGLGDRAVRA